VNGGCGERRTSRQAVGRQKVANGRVAGRAINKPEWFLPHGAESGFTLLEVMIAVVIFGVAALALAQYQSYQVQKRVVAKRYSQAVNFAEQKVEDLRNAVYYDSIVAGTTTENSINGDSDFRRITTVTAYTYYKTVTVEVQWKTPGGATYHTPVILKTIIAQ